MKLSQEFLEELSHGLRPDSHDEKIVREDVLYALVNTVQARNYIDEHIRKCECGGLYIGYYNISCNCHLKVSIPIRHTLG